MSKVALIFPGQGAQYEGMGKELYDNFEASRNIFEQADKALGFSITDICFGDEETLKQTKYTQPAILTTSIAALEAINELGIEYDTVAGLSLGEYSALVASEGISFKEGVRLVHKRGTFMQESQEKEGSLLAIIGLDEEVVKEAIGEVKEQENGVLEIANLNCPKQVVVGGELNLLDKLEVVAKEKGAKMATRLNVSGAFHTSMQDDAAAKLKEELDKINVSSLQKELYTNLTGDKVSESDIKDTLYNQVKSTVHWEKIIKNMIDDGVDTFIEVGPGKVLSGFLKRIDRKKTVINIEDLKSYQKLKDSLGK